MTQSVGPVLFGWLLTVLTACGFGRMLLVRLRVSMSPIEVWVYSFLAGSALLSLMVFGCAVLNAARPEVFLGLAIVVAALALWRGRPVAVPESYAVPRAAWLTWGAVAAVFGFVYFVNALAPEYSPDGSTYHLGLVARYLRAHGFERITTHMYANLSQGVEMLFLFAFAFGWHSAAALVHFTFLLAAALAILDFGFHIHRPWAGVVGSLLFFLSPIVGRDGTSAYNDVAVAVVLFAMFCAGWRWAESRRTGWLVLASLLAGFGYAVKYTAGIGLVYLAGLIGWTLWRAKDRSWRPFAIFAATSAPMIAPWMIKNWLWLDNPVSPFFNRWFPNPYVFVSFEQDYAYHMRHYDGLRSYAEIPWGVTVGGGVLGGFMGPVFLLAPLALLALGSIHGRRLLLAGFVIGCTYFANVGTRFLIPPLPFLALAMALPLVRWWPAGLVVVAAHAALSWPGLAGDYCDNGAWRIRDVPWRAALRLVPEEEFLQQRISFYEITRRIEQVVPRGERIFTFTQAPEAYTSREILLAYQSASNNVLGDILWTPLIPEVIPKAHIQFLFPGMPLRRVRLVQTAGGVPDHWSIAEFRVYYQGRELERAPSWRLRANPNPWNVTLAFDNNPATRWRSWHGLYPGMFVEIDFGGETMVDEVRLEWSSDQHHMKVRLEGAARDSEWREIDSKPSVRIAGPIAGLRRAATAEFLRQGVKYLLIFPFDYGAEDFRTKARLWGLTPVAEASGAVVYRIEPEKP